MTDTHRIEIQVDSRTAVDASRNLGLLTGSVNNAERSIAGLNGAAMAAKAALVGLAGVSFGFAIKEIASFETKMLQLKALTMANETQMKSMEKQARELGATTAFSAQQAAEGMGVLASTGLKTNEIMAATPKILQLAAAGNLELAKAAEIAMASMKGMGLQIQDLGHINDVFAKVAADSAISVEQVGVAMGEAAPSMRAFGVSIETTAAAIGILKDNGIKVGSIGDGLKTMMGALTNETKEHVAILEKHNLTYKDLNVETLGLTKVLNNLKGANFTAAESIKLLGLDAFNTSLILMNNTKALDDNGKALKATSGDAERQSDILNQGLSKAWDALKGSLGEAAQQFGEVGTKIDDTGKSTGGLKVELTNLIQAATGVISIYEGLGDKFAESNKLTKEQYQNLKDVAGELRGMAGAVGGVAAVTGAIWAARTAVIALNAVMAINPLVRMGMIAGGAVGYVTGKMADNQSTIDKQIETSEKRIAAVSKWGWQNMVAKGAEMLGAKPFDVEKEKTKIIALKQYKEEQLAAAKAAEETGKSTEVATPKIQAHSLSLDTGAESAKKAGAAHKGLSDAQKEVNKQQEEYNRLVEKFKGEDPFEKYNKEMSELYRVQKSLNPETFLTNQKRIASEFEKSTVDLNAYNQALRERENLLSGTARGKFEKGTDELRAKKHFMSEKEYAVGQDKLAADYLTQQQGKDFKTPAEQAVEAKKGFDDLTKTLNDSGAAMSNFGNSGKLAFDGLLGGISAVAGSIGSFSEEMGKLNDDWSKKSAAYSDAMLAEGATYEQREKATKDYYQAKDKFEKASFAAEISGARQLAGAASKMFGEKSAARKAFHAIEMGMSIIEMAMAAKKMVVDIAAGAANMFAQGGFAGFAGVAAMAAVMAGLGVAMSSGSGSVVDNTAPASKATGTVLGDNSATSNSVRNIVDTLNDISDKEYPELKAISDGFRGIDNSMYKLNQIMAQATANFTNMQNIGVPAQATGAKATNPNGSIGMQVGGLAAGTALGAATSGGLLAAGLGAATGMSATAAAGSIGMAAGGGIGGGAVALGGAIIGLAGGLVIAGLAYGLGKLLGIGKTKITQMGEGIVVNTGSLLTDGMLSAVDAQAWRKDEFKTKGWFSSKKRIVETFGALSDDVYASIAGAIGAVTNSSLILANELNVLDDVASRMNLQGSMPFLKIDWLAQKNKGEDVSKLFNDQLNAYYDKIATNLFKYYVGEFQKLGEGMLETAARVTIEMRVVQGSYKKLGFDLGEGSVGLAGFSDRLVQMYNSTADAKDGLKNFIETMNDIYNLTHNEGQKSQKSITDVKAALTSPLFKEMTGQEFDASRILDKKYTLEMYTLLNEASSKLAIAASDAETEVKKLSPAVDMAHNPKTDVDLTELAPVFKTILGTSDFSRFTWEKVGGGWTEGMIKAMSGVNDLWDKIIFVGDSNRSLQQKGIAAGGGATTPAAQADDLKVAEANSVAAAERAKSVQGMVYDLETLSNKTIETFTKLQDEYLKTTMSADDWKKVERDRIIDEKFIDIKENMRDYSNLSAITSAMIKEDFEGVAKSGVITAASMQRYIWTLEDAAKATKKLADAAKYLTDFSSNISGWVNNQKVTQIGSTKSQLDAAGKSFDALMLRINLPTNAADKKLAMSGITQSADAYMNSIKNFYGSSKAGQDLMQSVIDKVGVLPESVDIQQLILDKLEEIRAGVIEIPKFGGVLSPESTTVIDKLAADIKAAVDKNLTAPTLQNAQALNANAQVMLTLQNISAMTNSTDGVFLDKLIKSVGSNTGLNATVNATIYSSLDPTTKQSVVDTLANSFAAIQVSISKFKANPTAEGLASLQNDISRFDTLVANVNGKVTALNLDPNNAVLKAGLQGSIDQMNAFSAKISGLTLSPEAIKAANAQIASNVKPEVVANVTFKDANPDSKAYLQSIKDVTETATKGLEIKITPKVEGTALNTLNEQTVAAISNMTKLGGEINNVATKLGDKQMSTVMASTSGGKDAFNTSKLVVPVSLRDNLESSGAISYFESSLTESQLAAGERIGGKLTSVQASNYTKAMATIFKKGSAFNKDLSYVDAYNQSHPNNSISMDLMYTVLDDASLKLGGIVTSSTLPKTATVAQKALAEKTDYDAALAKYKDAESIMNNHKSMYASTIGFNAAHPDSKAFATGGAFTNGIVTKPTAFNMGLMGEAGSEAIMPLQNIGGSLGVRVVMPAANDSGNSDEELAELKAQNKILLQQNAILREGFGQLIEQSERQNQSLRSIKTTTKEAAYA